MFLSERTVNYSETGRKSCHEFFSFNIWSRSRPIKKDTTIPQINWNSPEFSVNVSFSGTNFVLCSYICLLQCQLVYHSVLIAKCKVSHHNWQDWMRNFTIWLMWPVSKTDYKKHHRAIYQTYVNRLCFVTSSPFNKPHVGFNTATNKQHKRAELLHSTSQWCVINI